MLATFLSKRKTPKFAFVAQSVERVALNGALPQGCGFGKLKVYLLVNITSNNLQSPAEGSISFVHFLAISHLFLMFLSSETVSRSLDNFQ